MQVGPDFVFHVIGSNHIPDSIRRLNGTMIDDVVRIVIHGYGERQTLHSLNTLSTLRHFLCSFHILKAVQVKFPKK
jgi:hypothetical protein